MRIFTTKVICIIETDNATGQYLNYIYIYYAKNKEYNWRNYVQTHKYIEINY